MDQEIERRRAVCAAADNAEWEEVIARARSLSAAQKAFIRDNPPGLVRALWAHFEATRDRCGCATPAHEGRGCQVRLIEKLLLEQELD
jgi:hypothetical protein